MSRDDLLDHLDPGLLPLEPGEVGLPRVVGAQVDGLVGVPDPAGVVAEAKVAHGT